MPAIGLTQLELLTNVHEDHQIPWFNFMQHICWRSKGVEMQRHVATGL